MCTALDSGFATAVLPVNASTVINPNTDCVLAGEVGIPVADLAFDAGHRASDLCAVADEGWSLCLDGFNSNGVA